MTNAKFCKEDELFQLACDFGKVRPTKRQASKFRMGKGTAYAFRLDAHRMIEQQAAQEATNVSNT